MIIDWKKIAKVIYDDLKQKITKLEKKPTLWVILVWNNESSIRYIKQKQKWAEYVWIKFILEKLPENINEMQLYEKVKKFNEDENISWYMIQTPLPKHLNTQKIFNSIQPKKDVDWFHPNNQWKALAWDESGLLPCTPAWIMEILNHEKINVEWKTVCVIWRSNIVWKPVISLLINAWATVIACNSKTKNIEKFTTQAEIVIVAAWSPWLLKVNMLKVWAVVIDVWFTVINEKIHWDADTKLIDLVWSKVTPVPGWVWALTVACLMKNTLKAYKLQNKK